MRLVQVAKELQREREHSSYLVDELKGALNSPRAIAVPVITHVAPKAIAPSLARRMSSVAGAHPSCMPPTAEGGVCGTRVHARAVCGVRAC